MIKIFAITGLILQLVSSIIYCGDLNSRKFDCRIIRRNDNSVLILTAEFFNGENRSVNISFKFDTEKKGISGNSSNSQSGSAVIKANSKAELSKVSLNLDKRSIIKAYLSIFKDNITVARDSLILKEVQ